jgi:hypothetical protein
MPGHGTSVRILHARVVEGLPELPVASSQSGADAGTLLYADFEKLEANRPVSAGGFIQIFAYEESAVHKSTFKGLDGADPPAPELVHVKKDDPNHAMKFDFSLLAPNQSGQVSRSKSTAGPTPTASPRPTTSAGS